MDDEIRKYISFINARYGIDLSVNKDFAKKQLFYDMMRTRTDSVEGYLENVKNNKNNENNMISQVSVGHTYFFRDNFHFTHTKDIIVPNLIKRYNDTITHIWCCAVSTGQEAYSLAMMLDYYFNDLKYIITATDLSAKSINTAKKGIYPMSDSEQIPGYLYGRYCRDNHNGTFSICGNIKKHIRFGTFNLMDKFSYKNRFDAIYCRHVLMYFSTETKSEIISKLYEAMKSGGYLYIGSSENISIMPDMPFEYVSSSVYKKP